MSIHPATRALLAGKKPAGTQGAKTAFTSSATISATDAKVETSASWSAGEPEKPRPAAAVVPGYVPPLPRPEDLASAPAAPRGERHKVKRRLVVGNVSKWIACDQREDLATHKWMLYVRGDEDRPDVSDVVSKVRFLIHPSYSPHDLVDVTQPPFHLTRRGWGEFPARVQIHFKGDRDKPIDVIHHIKLDRTYTGLQTRGAETLVDVWLHDIKREATKAPKVKRELADEEDAPYSEGWVIPHDDPRTGMVPPSVLEQLQGLPCDNSIKTENGVSPKPSMNGTEHHDSNVKVKSEENTANGKSLLNGESTVATSGSVATNGSPQSSYIKCKDKNGEPYYLPITLLPNNQKRQVVGLSVMPQEVALKKPTTSTTTTRTKSSFGITQLNGGGGNKGQTIRLANGKKSVTSQVKTENNEHHQQITGIALPPKQSNSHSLIRVNSHSVYQPSSILRASSSVPSSAPRPQIGIVRTSSSSSLPPGTSLLKRSAVNGFSVSPAPSPCPSPSRPSSAAPPTTLTELERATPNVSLDTWNKILGRDQDDETQADVENRLAKKGMHLLKKQIRYYVFLRYSYSGRNYISLYFVYL